jgi:hypothetical protein
MKYVFEYDLFCYFLLLGRNNSSHSSLGQRPLRLREGAAGPRSRPQSQAHRKTAPATFYKCNKKMFVQTGTTPLFFAAQGGHLDIVNVLLDKGAPLDSASVVSVPL